MDTQQPPTNNSQPAGSTTGQPPSLPPNNPPTPPSPRRSPDEIGTQAGNPQPTTNNTSTPLSASPQPTSPPPPPPVIHPRSSIFHLKSSRLAPLALIILVATTFATSYFFFSKARQPKPQSRASTPSPSISLLATYNPQPTTDNSASPSSVINLPSSTPPLPTLIPTSSGFGAIINSPTPLPPPPENLPPATFNITAANDAFTPNQLTVQRGQIVTIYFNATDKAYDVSIPQLGLSRVIQKGDRKSLEFQASAFGQYIFSCTSYCNAATARGILTVKP